MLVPMEWMKTFVDIPVSLQTLADKMTMSGTKAEGIKLLGEEIQGVVVGRILSIEPHPDADKLVVCKVDTGADLVRIVTGAPNVEEGQQVPVALDGAMLPGSTRIQKGLLRGVESAGMLCSGQELGLNEGDYPGAEAYGILILQEEYPLGMDIKEALGLADAVMDFEITSNRPDCLCMAGMAREIALTLDAPVRMPEIQSAPGIGSVESEIQIQVLDPDLCPRYAVRVVKDIRIAPSPRWLRRRLAAAGVRPINNIVDITNYVMIEMGQPMHAFDLAKLEGGIIQVRRAQAGETIVTLDDKQRSLTEDMLVIADAKKPVAVAGVMGGANSEISPETKDILLESAVFQGTSVRLTSKALGLRSEASARFEKGLNLKTTLEALDRAAQLIQLLNAGTLVEGVLDVCAEPPKPQVITCSWRRINDLLGLSLSAETLSALLRRAGIECTFCGDSMDAVIPHYRLDMEGCADLAEEAARIYGYDKIPMTLMEGSAARGSRTSDQRLMEDMKAVLTGMGFYEAVTYSFTSSQIFERLGLAPEDCPPAVPIANPLGEDQHILRTSLIPSLLEVLARNFNRRTPACSLFEVNNVFHPKSLPMTELPSEIKTLAMGEYGAGTDFFSFKGKVENVLLRFGLLQQTSFRTETIPGMHPGRCARLYLELGGVSVPIGAIGEIHPKTAEAFEMAGRVYAAELDLMVLVSQAQTDKKFEGLPRYPAVTRDLAMVVQKSVRAAQVHQVILEQGCGILEEAVLFDVYEGSPVPPDSKSLAYALTYRAKDRTLKDAEVQAVHQKILSALTDSLGARLR